jgi:TRAP-type C4-dicarboxylate transport system permease small subunit
MMLEKIRIGFRKVTWVAISISGLSIALMMGYGFFDVLSRDLFDRPFYGTFELSELLMVVAVFLSLASCQAEDRHMRVDFLFPYMNKAVRTVIDIFTYVCGIVLCGFLSWYTTEPALYSWSVRERTDGIISFPIYPVKIIIVVGVIILGIQLFLDLSAVIRGIRHGLRHS